MVIVSESVLKYLIANGTEHGPSVKQEQRLSDVLPKLGVMDARGPRSTGNM